MSILRFDPFRDFDRMTQLLTQSAGGARQVTMPMDAYRDGDRFVIHFDLPGVDAESIDLTVERNVLTVRAERGWQPKEGQEVVVSERPQGTFTRQLFLGDTLDAEQLKASYAEGVLTLTIPVAAQAKPRKVQIAVGDAAEGRTIEAGATGDTGEG